MKSVLRTTAYLLALVMTAAFACGCYLGTSPGKTGTRPHHGPLIDMGELSQRVTRVPVTIMTKSLMHGSCRVKYPFVCDTEMDLINLSLNSFFMEFAADCEARGGTVDFKTEFNNYGLLSFMLFYRTPDGQILYERTANFDCDSGELLSLSDCFGVGSEVYSTRLKDIVARSVEQNGYTPLGEGPVFDDSTQFLFTYGGIYLVYREYEAFSFDAGSPRIKVKISSVMDLLAPDALITRVK